MRVFYGAAIQGRGDRRERADFNRFLIEEIKSCGHEVITEHTSAETYEEALRMLENAFGKLPEEKEKRTAFNRVKIIESLAGSVDAAIFDVTVPSLGTGIELVHAYIRPNLGLSDIPILLLFDPSYGRELSGMIRGMTKEELPSINQKNYSSTEEAQKHVKDFLEGIRA